MKKFICGHCGGRIAVPPKHLGRLVTCPDCGKATHPLAADILAAAREGDPAARSTTAEPDRNCENCGRKIGKLEQPKVWDKHVVCTDCHTKLAPPAPAVAEVIETTSPRRKRAGRGKATTEAPLLLTAPDQPKALPEPTADNPRNLPVPAEGVTVELPASLGKTVAGHLKTLVMSRVLPTKVQVQRASEGNQSAAPRLHVHPLAIRFRVIILLAVTLVAGVFLYGFLALVRDFMGILTTLAIGLVVIAIGIALGRLGWHYIVRWFRNRRSTPADAPAKS